MTSEFEFLCLAVDKKKKSVCRDILFIRSILSPLQDEKPKISIFSYITVTTVEGVILCSASCANRFSISFPAAG